MNKQMMKKGVKPRNLLFCMALIIYLCYQFWENTFFAQNIDLYVPRIVIFFVVSSLLFLKIFFDKSYRNIVLFILILFLFAWIGYSVSNIRELILLVLFIYEARNVDLHEIFKIYLYVILLGLLFTISISLIGIWGDNVVYGSNGRTRAYLGFTWTSYSANLLLTLTLTWGYLKQNSKRYFCELVSLLMLNVFVFAKTNTRAAFIDAVLFIVGFAILKRKKNYAIKSNLFNKTVRFSFVWFSVLSILLTVGLYKFGWIQTLNDLLSNRLFYNSQALARYPVNFFGNIVSWNMSESKTLGLGYFYIDCSYINILIQYGIIVFAIVIGLLTFLMSSLLEKNDYIGFWCLFIVAFHSFTDPQLILLLYNPFLLLIGNAFFNNYYKKKKWFAR